MRLLIIISCAIAGLVVGFFFWQVSEIGFSQAWEKLPSPPQAIVEIIPAGSAPFIKTSDGATYRYENWHNARWVAETISQGFSYPADITKPCDLSAPEFFWLSNPPRNIADCVQEKVIYADGYARYTFVLDRDGSIWQSGRIHSAYDSIPGLLCFPSLGLLIGVCLGIYVVFFLRRRKDAASKLPAVGQFSAN